MDKGTELFKRAVFVEEKINMDYIGDAIDYFNNVINLIQDQDLELSAIAHSKLGQIFHRCVKNQLKAKENFMSAIRLANSLFPKVVTDTKWFQISTKLL